MLGIFLDTEANGLNATRHKILEIAFKIVDVKTGRLCSEFHSPISITFKEWEKSDPNSLQVNGFSWPEISEAPTSKWVAEQILALFKESDIKRGEAVFICQNPSFDRVFFSQLIDPDLQEQLLWPYHWLDLASMYWAKTLCTAQSGQGPFPWDTGCSKDKIAMALNLPKEAKPHRAMNGVDHLILCYSAVVGFPDKQLI